MPVISKWKFERCTTSRHLCINQKVPTSSHIHSSTGHKTSVAASPVKNKLGRNHLLTIDCTYMQEEAKSQSFSHLGYYHQSRFLSEADLSPFQRDCSFLEHISVPCG